MCCIPALYSIMILFCIEMCGSTSFCFCSSSSLVCFSGLWFWSEWWERNSSPRGGAGSRERCTAASNLPAEPVAAFRGLKHMLYKTRGGWEGSRGGQEAGNDPLPTLIQTSLGKTWRGTNPLTFPIWRQARWFSHRSNRLDTTMRQHNKVHIWA